ncbi:MAG: DUF3592 domain-containing protein [Myxococcaceae bacterium]|jgi:hypothetical protein|nr:DUF3592 domain-containing protein [Myxococcaceae bacterium]
MADPLEDFARRRIEAAGGVPSAERLESIRRADARTNARRAFVLPLTVGIVFLVVGLLGTACAAALWWGLVPGDRRSVPVLLLVGFPLLATATVFIWAASRFQVHWYLADTGRRARAIVLSVERSFSASRRARGPTVLSTTRVRLAVQVDGGAPYETTTVTIDQVHGGLTVGQPLTVFVDAARPRRVFIAEP